MHWPANQHGNTWEVPEACSGCLVMFTAILQAGILQCRHVHVWQCQDSYCMIFAGFRAAPLEH